MPLYVSLLKYSPEGMKGISPERFQRNKALIESKGGKLIGAYALMGEWDVLTVTDFPDEKSAMSALVAVGKSGIGTTQTMTAIAVDQNLWDDVSPTVRVPNQHRTVPRAGLA